MQLVVHTEIPEMQSRGMYFVRTCKGAVTPKTVETDLCHGDINPDGAQTAPVLYTCIITGIAQEANQRLGPERAGLSELQGSRARAHDL